MSKQKVLESKGKLELVEIIDEKTIYIEGKGKATDVGELDMRKFIHEAMNLNSFWK
ncbi:hypothetical protein [Pontibacillus yanchengensis]|uniref:hypothetical protein n=1 Tax=Pontibacillus yanchengensis TaxID=462910 RepID=UPI000B181D7B|nr:hypothetical protein [Pontibacillus yanchengensis]